MFIQSALGGAVPRVLPDLVVDMCSWENNNLDTAIYRHRIQMSLLLVVPTCDGFQDPQLVLLCLSLYDF